MLEKTLKIYNNHDDALKNLVKQDLVNKNYVLIDGSNEENIFLTPKGKQDYIKYDQIKSIVVRDIIWHVLSICQNGNAIQNVL